jgi:hypothetical protein
MLIRNRLKRNRKAELLILIAAFMPAANTASAQQLALAGNAVPAAVKPVPQIQLPPTEAMIILIRSSIVALGQANVTNNYSVMNSLGSRAFRDNNPPNQLAKVFESFRANKIDLTPVVYINPQLTAQPGIQNGRMRLVGNFPSQPMQVNFDLTFEPDEGTWKLFGLGVNLSKSPLPAAK